MSAGSLDRIGGTAAPGGGGYPALVAPVVTEGVIQREASGTTTATVNVGASSGGAGGPYTYSAVSLDAPGGSSAAVSGTVPGALSVTGLGDDEAVVLSGTVTDPTTSQVVSWSHTVDVAAATAAGGWTSPTSYDYGSDNDTSVTITVGGGDTALFEADGTTPKGTVNAYKRANNPTSSAVVAADGIDLQAIRNGTSNAFTCNWVLTSSDVDFTDASAVFAIDCVVRSIALTADDDQINVSLGNDADPFGGDSFVLQVRRLSGATEYRRRRVDGGTSTDTAFTSGTAVTSIAVRWVVFRGRITSMLYQLNSTTPLDVVEAGGSVVESWKGGSLGTLEGTVEQLTSPFYVGVDLGPRGTSGQVDCTVTHIEASRLDITP